MRNRVSSVALIFGLGGALAGAASAGAGEMLGFPPPDPPGTVRVKMNVETVQKTIDEQLKSRFAAAAGPAGHLLTSVQAKDAGWGFIADHFTEIDPDNDGFVTFTDVSQFMAARSPIQPAKQNEPIQIPIQIIE